MIRGVIFDYGSTLIFFNGEVAAVRVQAHEALAKALAAEGLVFEPQKFLRRFARALDADDRRRQATRVETTTLRVLEQTIEKSGLPALTPAQLKHAMAKMYSVYQKHWKPYPGTPAALRQVKALRLKTALLSNAGDEADVHRLLHLHKLEKTFQPVVISAAIGIRKPDPRAFQPILDEWKLPPDEIVMVGDQLGMDILGAQKLGLRTIWLRTEEKSPTNRPYLGKILADAQVRTIGEAAAILSHWSEKE